MEYSNKIIINIQELTIGEHRFEYNLDSQVFVGYLRVKKSVANVTVKLVRLEAVLDMVILINGTVTVDCERCLDELIIPIKTQETLTVKLFANKTEKNDNYWELAKKETSVDLTQTVYETIILAMPVNLKHEDIKDCNPDMISRLSL